MCNYKKFVSRVSPIESRLDEGLNTWLLCYASKNYWRVASWYDLDDLIQDGYLILVKLEERYSEVNQKNFMGLFKSSFSNYITNLANRRTRCPFTEILACELSHQSEEGEGFNADILDSLLGGEPDLGGEILTIIRQAPWEVWCLLRHYLTEEGKDKLLKTQWFGSSRGTLNERLCKLAGLDPAETDLVFEVKNYLSSTLDE